MMTATELLAEPMKVYAQWTGACGPAVRHETEEVVLRAIRTLAAQERLNKLADADTSPFTDAEWGVGVISETPCDRGFDCPRGMTEDECEEGDDDMVRCKQPLWRVSAPSMYGPDADTPADALVAWAAMPEVA